MIKVVYFDMDGTFVNFYGVPNWLEYLRASDTTPYAVAAPLFSMSQFARLLNRLRANGYYIGIVSWTSKTGSAEFNEATRLAKLGWIAKHLPSVIWDEIKIVPYGTPKHTVVRYPEGILLMTRRPTATTGLASPTMWKILWVFSRVCKDSWDFV